MTIFNAPRALTVKSPAISIAGGQPVLVPLKLEGTEGINSLFEYRLTLQSPDALNFMGGTGSNFDLDSFIGLELTCYVELEGQGSFAPGIPGGGGAANRGAGVREISGLITVAELIKTKGTVKVWFFKLCLVWILRSSTKITPKNPFAT